MSLHAGNFKPKPIEWIKEGECMICTSHRCDTAGYPCVKRGEKFGRIGRQILSRKYGKLAKLVMRHTCDNRKCINPAHLLIGTRMENIQDMINRGRAWWQTRVMTKTERV